MKKIQVKCLKCGSLDLVKNGMVFGAQRYKCKHCHYQFTKLAPAGKPIFIKLVSHALYLSGMSMRQIAPIIGVTGQTVSRWMKKWHPTYMNEVGDKSQILEIKAKNLIQKINLNPEDDLRIVSTKLPSGAIFHTVIQLSSKE
ncbi:MAG: helix-turn-helix domain-containing protein [Alphaproteobacteria bacterium]|nr:helix-turn-helix domain-containing protein [Alphaproteobacteria bacterium]